MEGGSLLDAAGLFAAALSGLAFRAGDFAGRRSIRDPWPESGGGKLPRGFEHLLAAALPAARRTLVAPLSRRGICGALRLGRGRQPPRPSILQADSHLVWRAGRAPRRLSRLPAPTLDLLLLRAPRRINLHSAFHVGGSRRVVCAD